MAKMILAVDPGASGGIANWFGCVANVSPMPHTDGDVVGMLRNLTIESKGYERTAYLEQIVKHMGAGIPASTMAVYAQNHGIILGALMMAGWRVELVTPQAWQKALGLGITGRQRVDPKCPKGTTAYQAEKKRIALLNGQLKRDWKNKLLATAQRLYPALSVTLKTADALLILRYAELREANMLSYTQQKASDQ